MNSMTGYGRASRRDRRLDIEVEVRSVNHRFLALKQALPEGLSRHEAEIEREVRSRLSRGSLSLTVSVRSAEEARPALPDLPTLRACHRGLERARRALGLPGPVEMRDLLAVPTLWTAPPPESAGDLWPRVRPLLGRALAALAAARAREGAAAARDLRARLASIERHLRRVEGRIPASVDAYRRRLEERIRELLVRKGIEAGTVEVLREVAVYADRCDVSEEVHRLRAHMAELRRALGAPGPVGRRLEFLVQEMSREANTIASKGNDAEIASCAVALKAELEKIREQVENIE